MLAKSGLWEYLAVSAPGSPENPFQEKQNDQESKNPISRPGFRKTGICWIRTLLREETVYFSLQTRFLFSLALRPSAESISCSKTTSWSYQSCDSFRGLNENRSCYGELQGRHPSLSRDIQAHSKLSRRDGMHTAHDCPLTSHQTPRARRCHTPRTRRCGHPRVCRCCADRRGGGRSSSSPAP